MWEKVHSSNKRFNLDVTELLAVENCDAQTVIDAFYDNIICRFGLSRGISVLTDNGSAFISKLAASFCKTFGIKQFFFLLIMRKAIVERNRSETRYINHYDFFAINIQIGRVICKQ
jgi:hypothetical protein